MRFNSQSVTLNRGINLMQVVQLPSTLESYTISPDVWEESIVEFNKQLDERSQVSEIIEGIKVDVLRINRTMGNVVLWMTAKENDAKLVEALTFMLKGTVVFEDEKSSRVERIFIKDLLYEASGSEAKSIFKKKS
jgi:hypothetical protein